MNVAKPERLNDTCLWGKVVKPLIRLAGVCRRKGSVAGGKHSGQFGSAERNQPRVQAAMPFYPLADHFRIARPQNPVAVGKKARQVL